MELKHVTLQTRLYIKIPKTLNEVSSYKLNVNGECECLCNLLKMLY